MVDKAITATKRLQEIVDLLDQKGYVKTKELSKKYQVSIKTIRKDLAFFRRKRSCQERIRRSDAFCTWCRKNIDFREKQKYDEKKEIARCVNVIKLR